MANYNSLKSAIQEVIRTNGDNEITGALLQQTLLAIVNALGIGYQFIDVAIPGTNPGTPDQNVFYLAGEPGTYSNFGFTVGKNELAVFTYAGMWAKLSIPFPGDSAPDSALYKVIKYNLYNPDDPDNAPGYYLNHSGNLVSNASYLTTGYIPFSKSMGHLTLSVGGINVIGFGGYMCLYDANKTLIRSVSEQTDTGVDWEDNVVYARFSIPNYTTRQIQIETGSSITQYMEPGKYFITPAVYIDGRRIIINSLSGEKVIDATLTPKKCTFFRFNLFNPNDPDNAPGYYLDMRGGLASNANYLATGYIPFSSGKICASVNGAPGAGGGFIVLYDSQKNVVASMQGNSTGNVATWQDNVAFVRFSIAGYTAGNIQVEPGDTITDYIPFGEYRLDPQFTASNPQLDSILGETAGKITQSALAANTQLTLPNYPYHNKKGDAISMFANVGAFTSLCVGKGWNQYRGRWIKITATDVILQWYESEVGTLATVAHGLTISTFVQLSMESDADGVLHLALNTLSGTFQHDFAQWDYEANYEPFVYCDGALTNVVLNATNTDYRCPVWAFGDSYFGVNIGRWPGWVFQFGYTNFLINGLAGQNSPNAFVDLKKALRYGTPKYLLWCLGMNDSDANYESYFDQIKTLCEQKGITLVAAKIPSVPGRNKETINAYIEASGVRFIDFYKAVGANSSGQWYAGFLSDDNLHPSTLGAQALAVRVLADFPELMQYGQTVFADNGSASLVMEEGPGENSAQQANSGASASGESSFAGNSGKASGLLSHAEGYYSEAFGSSSHAEGNETFAIGNYSHSEGAGGITNSGLTFSGNGTSYTTTTAHGFVVNTILKFRDVVAKVVSVPTTTSFTTDIPLSNTIISNSTDLYIVTGVAGGNAAHSEGSGCLAIGNYSHAEGNATRAEKAYAHSEGNKTFAGASASHTEGYQSETGGNAESNTKTAGSLTMSGAYAHAEGNATLAQGKASHSEGKLTFAKGDNSHAEGLSTEAKNLNEHAEGQYNKSNTANTTFGNAGNTIHSVGIGTSAVRKNAFEIMQNGDAYLLGIGGYDGTNPSSAQTVQQVIANLLNRIQTLENNA